MAASDQEVVSMVDVLEEGKELELEEEAAAVLGDSDDKCCTYPLGYINRQALYACMTCMNANQTAAGICLACSYECHEGHEFVELYTKRNFRCDCGNSKFPNMTCRLIKTKRLENTENKYNQNFTGVYCTCNRPYPDPEDEIADEMIQCVVCEDWFHGRHLGTSSVPENEDYQEMVCGACMKRCNFLWNYSVYSMETKVLKEESAQEVDIMSHDQSQGQSDGQAPSIEVDEKDPSKLCVPATTDTTQVPVTSDATISSTSAMESVKATSENEMTAPTKSDTATASVLDSVSCSSSSENADKVLPEQDAQSVIKQESAAGATSIGSSADIPALTVAPTHTPSTQEDILTASDDAASHSAQTSASTSGCGCTPSTSQQQVATTSSGTPSDLKQEDKEKQSASSLVEYRETMLRSTLEKASSGEKQEEEGGVPCRLKELSEREVQKTDGAIFWPLGWRTKLCSCADCKAMYEGLGVSFIQDSEDTVVAYEERGKNKRRSLYGQGMEALSTMDRVQQVEMLHGYQDMKSALSEFLKSFAEQGKVVTASDIQEFYDSLNRKRQRVGSASTVQYLCR